MIDANIAAASSSYGSGDIRLKKNSPLIQAGNDMAEPKARVGRMVLATFIAAFGPLSFGYALGYSSSALLDFEKESDAAVKFTESQGSWFSALITIGAILGGPLGGWMIEALGRKSGIMACGIPFEIGWLLICYAKNHLMLYFGRLICGIAVGMISLMVPVYIAEISSPKLRGTLGSVNQLAVTLGLVIAYSFGVLVKWRWLAFIGAIFPALLVLFMFFIPETPVWLLAHNKRHDAVKALEWFKGPTIDTENECYAIESAMDDNQHITCSEFCKPAILKPLFISLMVMFFQQFCGVNAVIFNCAAIFKDAGFENAKAVSIIVATVQFFGTGCACLIMDKAGRKLLLWTAALGMAISLVALGIYFYIYIPGDGKPTEGLIHGIHHTVPASKISWLAILSLMLFNLAFSLAWGPVPWLLMSELFPLKARGIAASISTLFNWSMAFVVTKTYVNFETTLTVPGTYWLYGCVSFVAFLYVLFFLARNKRKKLGRD
ncbi:hypothetical protein QZH41_020676 [Actinostola sp. cb2023]|nr:hypothetical protein QZH41_020676 [Actinostola sp. cb2023]